MLADSSAKLGDLHVFRMNGISIESRAVAKDYDKARIKGTRETQYVESNSKTLHLLDH